MAVDGVGRKTPTMTKAIRSQSRLEELLKAEAVVSITVGIT